MMTPAAEMKTPAAVTEAARIYAAGDIRVGREPVVGPGPGEVLLRATAVGLCGSDLHWFEEAGIGDSVLTRPLILGHEIGAVIAAGPRAGQRVAVDPASDCGLCGPCVEGRANLCVAMRFAGHGSTDGGLRTFMAWPERLLSPLPDAIGDDEAPLLEVLGVALHALDLGLVAPGGRAGVYGCGPIGLLLVQLLRRQGLSTVVATDLLSHRVAAAKSMGATDAFLVDGDAGSGFTPERRLARELPVDVAYEVSGTNAALSDAIAAVRPGGRVVLIGIPTGDRTTFEAGAARRKELALLECRRMVASDLPRAIQLVAAGSIDLRSLITHRFHLSEAQEAFETLAERRGVKVIVQPNAE
ncbi:MAG: alcohol dehydrogenase catalytic domain-containing protein [Candidatus Limnocylindrales bacterium]